MFGIFVFFFKTCRQYNPKVKARNKNLTFLLFCFVLFLITHWLYFSSSLSHLTIPLYFLTLSSLSTFHQLSLSCLTFLIFSPLFSLHFLLHYFIAPLFIPFSHSTFLLHFPCSTFLFYFLSPFSYPTFSLFFFPRLSLHFLTLSSQTTFSLHFLSFNSHYFLCPILTLLFPSGFSQLPSFPIFNPLSLFPHPLSFFTMSPIFFYSTLFTLSHSTFYLHFLTILSLSPSSPLLHINFLSTF